MTPKEQEIKQFYDAVIFPGLYTTDDITNVEDYLIYNRYLDFIEQHDIKTILDVGCGSGYITNIIAYHFPHVQITAIDFSTTIEHGKKIADLIGIKNVTWIQENFISYKSADTFDLVLSNGSIHHMPEFDCAVDKVKSLSSKYIMVGLYNKYGKWMQRKIHPKFITECFELDQIRIPFELSFTNKQALSYFSGWKLLKVTPSIFKLGVNFFSLFRGKWGGFTFYYFQRE
jgi:SAM-dependent methyltransferase